MRQPDTMTHDPSSPARERILAAARELFYRNGIRAVGVDTIIEHAGVAKMSLYRWFPTKDALIAAFLEREEAEFWKQWNKVHAQHAEDPRAELLAQLKWLQSYVTGSRFRGCPFLNTTAEFADATHPGRGVSSAHKEEERGRIEALAKAMGVRAPDVLADQLTLLIDGAFANSQVLGRRGPAKALEQAGIALIEAAGRASRRRR